MNVCLVRRTPLDLLMTSESDNEWRDLTELAMATLRRGTDPARGATRLFQIAVLPSFEVAASWDVFAKHDARSESYFVVRTIWDLPTDAAKLESPLERLRHPTELAPTIHTSSVAASAEQVAAWQAQIAAASVPPMPSDVPIGTDGVTYRLATGSFFSNAVFEWWEEGPPSWAPLVTAVREVMKALERLAPRSAV
ncbi:MAG: hypothetical protein AMXMBFR22_32880 [Phycisphaerae bacterium]